MEWWDDSRMFKTSEDAIVAMAEQVTPVGSSPEIELLRILLENEGK